MPAGECGVEVPRGCGAGASRPSLLGLTWSPCHRETASAPASPTCAAGPARRARTASLGSTGRTTSAAAVSDRDPGGRPGVGRAPWPAGMAALTWLPPAAGCRCDVGGALGHGCDPWTGACRCRPNTQGLTCSEWVPHAGAGGGGPRGSSSSRGPGGLPLTTLSRPGRRGTTTSLTCTTCAWSWRRRPRPRAAPCASASTPSSSRASAGGATRRCRPSRWAWSCPQRGGGAGGPLAGRGPGWAGPGRGDPDSPCPRSPQPRIVVRLNVTSPDVFRLVFRYVNRGPTSVSGRVYLQEEGKLATCTNCECLRAVPLPALP